MSLWSRIRLVFKTGLSSAIDRAEDPRKVLDYAYNQQQELLITMRRGLVDVATAKEQLEQQARRLETRIPHLDDQARRAVAAGREDLARVALERKRLAKAERLQARAKAIDTLVELGSFPPAGGGDFVEAELLRITVSGEIESELARIRSEVKLLGPAKESQT